MIYLIQTGSEKNALVYVHINNITETLTVKETSIFYNFQLVLF